MPVLSGRFEHLQVVDLVGEATQLAYDPRKTHLVIGNAAVSLALSRRPIVQNFKQAIGESDASFEGRPAGPRTTAAIRRWPIRFDGKERENFLSTKEATKAYLSEFLKHSNVISKQLIFGIPSVRDADWGSQYRAHISAVLTELGFEPPIFFPEPFAVFQYYRHVEELIPASRQPLTVLVVDLGGGTVDSCIIQTTSEGHLSRSGAMAKPLGMQSCVRAGKEIDRRLLIAALKKLTDRQIRQESTEDRINARPWVLLYVEQAKIDLSQRMRSVPLNADCTEFRSTINLPAGTYHPDLTFDLELTGEDLKKVITDVWYERVGIGATIISTINEARFREGQSKLQHIDRVILAGGSARLPFLRELLAKTFAGQVLVESNNIVMGTHTDEAVAIGIAYEAAAQSERTQLLHQSIGACLFSQLYFYSALRRGEKAKKPIVRDPQKNIQLPAGTIVDAPMAIGEFEVTVEIELPFRPNGSLFYWFGDRPDMSDPEGDRLNQLDDVIRTPAKATNRFMLTVRFDPDKELVTPSFRFAETLVQGRPFGFGGLTLKPNVSAYTGVDFGTSNSYMATLWAAKKQAESRYPDFTLKELAGRRLRDLDERIKSAREKGILTVDSTTSFTRREQANFVFQSVKIEGNPLSFGETEALLEGRKLASNNDMKEPINVRDAYEFALLNAEYLMQSPESFIRQLNKIILKDIASDPGEYRRSEVRLSGMEFTPPPWADVEPYMAQLANEIKSRNEAKSVIQRAAEAHCKLTNIHPFGDGNGRTARLLMNATLIQEGLPTVTVSHSEKGRYLDALASSNKGDISDFCVLIAEAIEAAIEEISTPHAPNVLSDLSAAEEPEISGWVPSGELVALMNSRMERAPIQRRNRYDSWAAAFGSLREDFYAACLGFNDLYGEAYRTVVAKFDNLPYDKYQRLLADSSATRTWFMGVELSSEAKAERFVFWFRHVSKELRATAKKSDFNDLLPPTEVSLALSRRVGGTFQALKTEPIRFREIAHIGGDWIVLSWGENESYQVDRVSPTNAANMFLHDVIRAYF